MPVLAYDEADKPFLSLPVTVALACTALVLGLGGGLLIADRTDDGGSRPAAVQPASSRAASPAPGSCPAAVASADAALAEAEKVDAALAAQTQVMNDLMAHRITGDQAVKQVAPALTAGSQHSVALDVATQRYRAAASGCRP